MAKKTRGSSRGLLVICYQSNQQKAFPKRYKNISHQKAHLTPQSKGLTLIEILAATALLGTLLTASLLAQANLKQKTHLLNQRSQAIQALNQWLTTQWASDPMAIEHTTIFTIDEHPNWRIHTQVIEPQLPDPIQANLIQVSLWDYSKASEYLQNAGDQLASVEVIVPIVNDQQDNTTSENQTNPSLDALNE